MTEIGFTYQIGKLKSIYGENKFHPARLKVIARALKLLTDDDFEIICEDIIANSNNPPTLKDFLKTGEILLHARRLEQIDKDKKLLESNPRCSDCEGDGYVSAVKIHQGRIYSYAFRCPSDSCLAAKLNVSTSCPKWSMEYEAEFQRRDEKNSL